MSRSPWVVRDVVVGLLICVVAPFTAWAALDHGRLGVLVVVGMAAAVLGAYVGLRHPLLLFWGLAAVLGGLPFGYLPGVHVPLFLLFAGAADLAVLVHPSHRTRVSRLEVAVVVLIVVSGMSLLVSGPSRVAAGEFAKWVVATSLVLALPRLSSANLRTFGRVYVVAAAANALFGMAILAGPDRILNVLRPFGYDAQLSGRYVVNSLGVQQAVRLGGTWVDPNIAGLGLLAAIGVCLLVFDGGRRWVLASVLVLGLVLTLSRASLFSLLAAAVLVLLFHTMRSRDRLLALGVGGLAVVVAACTPEVRHRVLMSFSGEDPGSTARLDALRALPHQLAGHWVFGVGWGGREFWDPVYAFTSNHVANGVLFTLYRGGLIVGVAFVAVFVAGGFAAARALRSVTFVEAVYGGIFLGFTLVALQLDHPVVAIPPVTGTLSLLLAFMVSADPARDQTTVASRSAATARWGIREPQRSLLSV